MKTSAKISLIALALLAVTLVTIFAVRWATASPRGKLAAREAIQSGANRIAAYEHFFNLCVAVQAQEAQLDALYDEREQTTGDDLSRVLANITGVSAQRQRSVFQYNADARKDYTAGQFRDSDLPYQLSDVPYSTGGKTSCGSA